MQENINFYLCDETEKNLFATGTLKQVLEIAAMKKLNAHVLNEFQSSDGEKFPGELLIVTNDGKPYYLPIFTGSSGNC